MAARGDVGMGRFLFGLEGRIGRAKFFFVVPVVIGIWLTGFAIWSAELSDLPSALADLGYEAMLPMLSGPLPHLLATLAIAALFLVGCYVAFALVAKRLHDRGKNAGWFFLMAGLPLAAGALALVLANRRVLQTGLNGFAEGVLATLGGGVLLWSAVELFLLRGMDGDNRFGPDPRRIDRS
jgi:uncharacterized membrane protein YhaH (DUF805 family)